MICLLYTSVSGHAEHEIACACVSSAVQLTANGVTELAHIPASVSYTHLDVYKRQVIDPFPRIIGAPGSPQLYSVEAMLCHILHICGPLIGTGRGSAVILGPKGQKIQLCLLYTSTLPS